ncbi:MAG: LD-carboxypeptidase [Desulfobacterales bacterium]|jgi:muramoyltetrapeptide carboxypeptidase
MNPLNKEPMRPPRLKPGGTVGIVAPASPFDQDIFNQGLNVLTSMGFRTAVPDEIFENNRYLAGSDAHRAKLVMQVFQDPTVDAIVCAKGGFGCLRVLPLLDFDVMRTNPKVFIGHSDITALLAAITAKTGLVTFHGPVVTTLAEAPELTRQSMLTAISSDTHLKVIPGKGITIKAGRAQGPIIGGNLTTLCHLLGTPYEPRFENHILLLEDRGEAHYRIDRMLFQMKLAGCFEGIAALVLGSFEECGAPDGIYQIFQEGFQDIPIPILAGFDVGHGKQNLTIPFGVYATLDTDKQVLSFDQSATVG